MLKLWICILLITLSNTTVYNIPNIDLSSMTLNSATTGVTYMGSAAPDNFGRSVSTAGDFNGDGIDDFVIGAPSRESNRGMVYVIFGKPGTTLTNMNMGSTLSSGTGFTIRGNAADDQFGYSVSAAGDMNGDGYGDIVIGAFGKNSRRGAIYVLYGRANPSNIDLSTTNLSPTSTGFRVLGDTIDQFGFSVSAAGRVNGDTYDDIIVGAVCKNSNQGAAYVIYGKATGANIDLSTTALSPSSTGFRIMGNAVGDDFGYAVSGAGNMNGDSYDDIVIAASQKYSGRGAVYVIYGKASPANIDLSSQTLTSSMGFMVSGAAAGNLFGRAVGNAKKVTGGSYDSLMVGAYGNNAERGMVYVIYGKASNSNIDLSSTSLSPSTTGFTIAGNAAGDHLGIAVGSAGDLNGDGYDDIILGADTKSSNRGAAYVIYGKASPSNINLASTTLNPASTGFTITGNAGSDHLGISVMTAGDVNSDGYVDLIVGAFGKSSWKGAAYLIHAPCLVPNCATCSNRNQCATCNVGYGLSGTDCALCPTNCAQCTVSTACTVCSSGYYLSGTTCVATCPGGTYPSSGKCQPCSSNCISCSSGTSCTTCAQGYGKSGSGCDHCPSNCDQCSVSSTCTTCATSYFLSGSQCVSNCPAGSYGSSGVCQACLSHCISCTSGSSCQQCAQGYGQSGSGCSNCPLNCNQCTVSSSCDLCSPSYFPSGSGCASCLPNCAQCSDSSSCSVCGSSYFLSGSLCVSNCPAGFYGSNGVCEACLSNCISCTSGSACDICAPGYGKSGFLCSNCPADCDQCAVSTSCDVCSSSYFLSASQCVSNCPAGSYGSNGVCQACSSGCISCTSGSTCQQCAPGYVISGSICGSCPLNCAQCSNTSSCDICTSPYFLHQSQCVVACPAGYYGENGACQACPSNCISCTSGSSCDICAPGYGKSGFLCSNCPANCDQCAVSTSCDVCSSSYFLSASQCVSSCPAATYGDTSVCYDCSVYCISCTSASSCQQCASGRPLVLGQCGGCPDNCDQCSTPISCDICTSPYFLSASQCVSICPTGSYGSNGVCQACPSGCVSCTSESSCQQCAPGYAISGSICGSCPLNCAQCSDTSSCDVCTSSYFLHQSQCTATCPAGYYGENGVCQPCLSNCISCTSGSSCDTCAPGYGKSGSGCDHCPSNCDQCSVSSTCTTCATSYFLSGPQCVSNCLAGFYGSNGVCQSCSSHCISCTSGSSCQQCALGYAISGSICGSCPLNCAQCSDTLSCDVCASPYFLHQSQCIATCPAGYYGDNGVCKPCSSNCISCASGSACQQCAPGYAISGLVCVSCPLNCALCTNPTSCDTCMSSFFRYASQCVANCPAATFSFNGECQSCSSNCISCTSSSSCQNCAQGYAVVGGQCANCPLNCAQCSDTSSCDVCASSYFLHQSQCTRTCPLGYYGMSGVCQPCSANCISCTSSSSCQECAQGYGLSDSVCATCPSSCDQCVVSTSCDICTSPFLLYEFQCVATCPTATFNSYGVCKGCSAHCIACTSASSCQVCEEGFILSNSECVSPSPTSTTLTKQTKTTQTISSGASSAGSVVSGSSIFLKATLVSKIVLNTRYLDILVTDELEEIYANWDTDLFSWNFPGSLHHLVRFRSLSYLFSQYKLDPPFLVNFWPNMMTIGIGFCFVLVSQILKKLFEKAKIQGLLYFLIEKLCAGSWNYTLVQIYGCLDDVVFYLILDARTNPLNSPFSWTSFGLAIVFCLLGCLLGLFNVWLVFKYQKIKQEGLKKNNMKELEEFNEKNKYVELLYSDFNDADLWSHSFFGFLLVRNCVASVIFTTFYSFPLLQTLNLMVLDAVVIWFLIKKKPVVNLKEKIAQYYFEIIAVCVHTCMFILSIRDYGDNNIDSLRSGICKAIAYMNSALILGALGFMLIEIYMAIRENIKSWKALKAQDVAVHPISLESSSLQNQMTTSEQYILADSSSQRRDRVDTERVQELENLHEPSFYLKSNYSYPKKMNGDQQQEKSLIFNFSKSLYQQQRKVGDDASQHINIQKEDEGSDKVSFQQEIDTQRKEEKSKQEMIRRIVQNFKNKSLDENLES